MPEELSYLWSWYLEVRTNAPLTYAEIAHWNRLTRKRVKPWEVELIRSIDRINWRVAHE